jgi:hypothetical protein
VVPLPCTQRRTHLLEEEEAGRHALAAGDGVALGRGRAHELEELLRGLEVVLHAHLLAHLRVHDALQDVLLGGGGGQVREQLRRLLHAVVPEVVDDEVQARLGDELHEARQHLQRLVAVAEDHHVVADEVVGLQHVPVLLQDLELGLGGLRESERGQEEVSRSANQLAPRRPPVLPNFS